MPPTKVKGMRSFLGHVGFYKRFIKDFLKNFKTIMQTAEKGCQI